MFQYSLVRTLIAILVSATMAIPGALASASPTQAFEGNGDTTDGIPVILQPVQTSDGHTAYIAIAPVKATDEPAVIQALAKDRTHARRTLLGVNGPSDPALKAAFASGNLEWINAFVIAPVEKSPLLSLTGASATLRDKIVSRLQKVSDIARRERTGMLIAIYTAAATGGFTYYASSSLNAATSIFAATFIWSAFQASCTETWDRVLDRAGELSASLASTLGMVLTAADKRIWSATGSFAVSLGANSALTGLVFIQAGTYQGVLNTLAYGHSASYDINDKNFANGIVNGTWGFRMLKNWVIARILLGSIAEVMAFAHVPYIQLSLTALTTGGLLWLVASPEAEAKVAAKVRATRYKLFDVVESFKNLFRRAKESCESAFDDDRAAR